MTTLAALLATVAALWLPLLWLTVTAPEGWEDSDGWHAGREGSGSVHNGRYTK